MSDPASWYLVIQLASAALAPSGVLRSPDPLVGPITEQQCESIKPGLQSLPDVVTVQCRKAVGMMSMSNPMPGAGYIRPIFEGELSVSVGSR